MSDTIQTSLLHRLWNTPLRDALRGRLSSRLDWRTRLAAANLPVPARQLIERVVKRTRLWRIEKAAVANELTAHFRDAMENNRPIDAVIAAFGDERQSARLIRRAKIRNRPMLWHGLRWSTRGFELLAGAYGVIVLFFVCSHPSPKVDYLAEMNRPIVDIPQVDRAWPTYRRVVLDLTDRQPLQQNGRWTRLPAWVGEGAGGKHWPEAVAWLRDHRDDVEALRTASARPALGFVLGPNGSINDDDLWPGMGAQARSAWAEYPSLNGLLFPYLPCMGLLADIMSADASLAQLEHDGPRLERDFMSSLDLAAQLRDGDPLPINGWVALNVDHVALGEIERTLRSDRQVLSDEQLIRLAHRISRPQTAADLFSLVADRKNFYDTIQHVFTDDGRGDGHLTADGMRFLMYVREPSTNSLDPHRAEVIGQLTRALGPPLMILSSSRRHTLAAFDRLMNADQANLRQPLRNVMHEPTDQLTAGTGDSVWTDFPFGLPIPSGILPRTYESEVDAEQYLGRRDGVMTAIALELYRRQHGRFPATLDALVPQFLPAIPADRITGDPIKYRLKAGQPLLYSVGVDRIDDGGKPAMRDGKPLYFYAAQWGLEPGDIPVEGDWILYPPQPPDSE